MTTMKTKPRTYKPAVCESRVIKEPIFPCELVANGTPGAIEINDILYTVEVLGHLPPVGHVVIEGYRLTKSTSGESHDVSLVARALECTCGDWVWRRQYRDGTGCKHTIACRRHLPRPNVDQF
jgi:hypothetical protein